MLHTSRRLKALHVQTLLLSETEREREREGTSFHCRINFGACDYQMGQLMVTVTVTVIFSCDYRSLLSWIPLKSQNGIELPLCTISIHLEYNTVADVEYLFIHYSERNPLNNLIFAKLILVSDKSRKRNELHFHFHLHGH